MVYFICTIIEVLSEDWYVSVPMKKIAEAKESLIVTLVPTLY
jgi:hypothetical protein